MEYSGEQRFDVIIVGAGIMGSCTAYEVSKRGCKVLLLEQFDLLHQRGSSHGESRTIRATYPEPYYSPLVLQSSRLWEEAQQEIGYRVHIKTQHLDMASSDDSAFQSLLSNCRLHSIPHRLLRPQQARDWFNGFLELPEGWLGLLTDLGGVLKPTKSVAMFQTLAIRRGAVVRDNLEVQDIVPDGGVGGGVWVSTSTGDRFHGSKCVVTAGAWTRKLVKRVSGLDLHIQPLQATLAYWKIKPGFEADFSPASGFPSFASYGNPYIYGTPSSEFPGLVKVAIHGGEGLCDPENRSWTVDTASVAEQLGPWIERTFSGRVESGKPAMVQVCLYSMTPDGDFLIDFLGGEFGQDVVVVGGFSGHGFKMGPVVGRIVADLVLRGRAEGVDLSYFRLDRFQGKKTGNSKHFDSPIPVHE